MLAAKRAALRRPLERGLAVRRGEAACGSSARVPSAGCSCSTIASRAMRLRIDERLLDGVDPRRGHARRDECSSTHSSTVRSRNAASSIGQQLVAVARFGRPSSRSARPRPAPAARSRRRAAPRTSCFAAADDEPAVRGLEVLERHDRGCAEFGRRGGTKPWVAAHGPMYISSWSAVSNSETSQSQPTPSRRARQMPASSAIAEAYPPERSTSERPLFVGGPPGSPVRVCQPASPCIM